MTHSLFDLLVKYDVPGPRYTSYPTAPAWTDRVGGEDYRRALGTLQKDDKLSLYFHLPFCENLCHFCGCMTVITKNHSVSRDYVDHLLREMDAVQACLPAGQKQKVSQIHFGGGTPNFLQPNELQDIVAKVREQFEILPDAEIAIEMHPRTSTDAFCETLAGLGFNRISLGVQDFDPLVQKLINRHQTYEMTQEMMGKLRALGFSSFNFDLIYGLPGQTIEGWAKTLEQVLTLKPNRLAIYSYAHIPWLKPYQRSFEDKDLPSPSLKILFFEQALRFFSSNRYQVIGMDHFALEDDELGIAAKNGSLHRNFMGYSTRAEAHQIGFGVSAISFVAGNYFQNQKELKKYEEASPATLRGFILDKDDHIRRDVIQELMCLGRISMPAVETKWGIVFKDYFAKELAALAPFLEDDLLVIEDDAMAIQGFGNFFLRNMAMVFDKYLSGIQKNAETPVFSRTV